MNIDTNNEPTPETVRELMLWLSRHGYAVAIFTPEECGDAVDTDALESVMIERGHEYINSQPGA
jgi:hypothetical protein